MAEKHACRLCNFTVQWSKATSVVLLLHDKSSWAMAPIAAEPCQQLCCWDVLEEWTACQELPQQVTGQQLCPAQGPG